MPRIKATGMASTSQARLERKVARVAEAALTGRPAITVIDVMMGIGWLTPPPVEDWRWG